MISITILESLSLMLKALLDHLLVHRMSPLFLLKALAILMIGPYLDHEDLEQLDEFDLEEMDLKWQVAMISMRLKKFYKTCRRLQFDAKEPVGFDKTKTGHAADGQENFALMAYRDSGSDTEQPPLMTGIYIPSRPDKEIDDSQFTYGPKQSKPSESDARSSDFNSCESNSSEETLESMPEPVVNEPKVVSQPKVWSDAPIIEEYESDSDDEHVSLPTKEQETPSFAFVNTVKHVKTPRQTVKEQNTCSQSPKPDKKDCSGLMSKKLGLGYGFTKKACFVCGSFSHLIRDCDFHEKRMAKQAELNKRMCKGTGQRENRPVWNNVQRVNHQNQFVPIAATPTNAARKVNTVKPIVNNPGKNFSGNVTPLFDSMLVQPTKDEGEASERPSESQPIPSPPHPSEDQLSPQPDSSLIPSPSIPIPDSNPEGSGGNHGGQSSSDRSLSGNEDGLTLQSVYDLCISLCKQVTIQAKEIKDLKAQIKKLKKKARPVITHHKAWMKSVSMKKRLAGKKSMQKKWMQKESVSKQGRKTAKSKPTAHKDQAFDDLDDSGAMDYMETEDAHNEKGVSTEDQVSTVKPDEGADKPNVSTDKIDEANDEEIARKVQEEWETEEKNKKLAEEEATKVALIRDYDDILG
ncbi:hypothetical protein Tco_0139585 [Tanacetum coccineum]